MNGEQRNRAIITVTQHIGFAMYHLSTNNLAAALQGLHVAQVRLQQLIDGVDEIDRVERREYENGIMEYDKKSEE